MVKKAVWSGALFAHCWAFRRPFKQGASTYWQEPFTTTDKLKVIIIAAVVISSVQFKILYFT